MHDLKLLRAQGGEGFVGQPKSLFPGSTYRYVLKVIHNEHKFDDFW